MPIIESYQIFNDYPDFMPMFNPQEMLEHGVHEGIALNPIFGIKFKQAGQLEQFVSKGLTQDVPLFKYASAQPDITKNAYKVLEEMPPFKSHPISIGSLEWFEWFIFFYYGNRNTWDTQYIDWWEKVVLWAFSKDAPKTAHVDQMLLQYSWNPGWKPKVIKGYKNE